MAAPTNLVLQLLITAKDEASAAFGKVFGYLDDNTKVIAGKIREAFAGMFGGGIDGAVELEAQLDRVAAKGGYTADEVNQLKVAAQQLGAQFGISGTEAAQGMESLAAAGLSAKEAIATLPQVLALASSEQISADAAATKLIDSLSIMGLGFEEAGRMADVLSKGADITTSSASQLAEALSMAGGTAKAAGMDLESTVAALDLLHKNGIKGSEAGTALRAILTALLDPASKASQELSALGISSRDLGTVLAALKDKGGAASGAILAFGQEAGPGLRALIAEGQGGLDDYTAQLKNAEGAANASAEAMGGNLKSALASMSSAWESLKTALLDPLLEPIAKQVRELAGAFQEGLSSDKFKAVQETIRAFGEAASKSIREFVQSFDFQGALTAIVSFAASAKDSFETVGKVGSIAANSLTLAWNAVTASFKAIGAGMTTLVASIVATLANIEEAASAVGLGSVERANALRQTALNMQQTAKDLIESVKTDANDMGVAFDVLTKKANESAVAVEALKTAAEIPPNALALEPLTKSLADYQGILKQTQIAQKDAAQAASDAEADYLQLGLAMDNGTGSVYRYEQATLAHKAAQEALKTANENLTQSQVDYLKVQQAVINGTDQERATAAASVKTKQDLIKESNVAVASAKKYADAVEGAAQAQLAAKDADIALAQAKGNTAEVQRLTIERTQLEAELSVKVARAKQAEQEAEYALAVAKRDQVAALVAKNQATQEDLVLAELVVQKELAEAQAAGVNAEAQEILAQKLRAVSASKSGATTATGDNTQAVQKNAEATDGAAKSAGGLAEAVGGLISYWRQQTAALSEATAALFELKAGLAGAVDVGILGGLSDEAKKATQEIDKATYSIKQFEQQMLFSTGSVGYFMDKVQKAGHEATRSYYEQKLAAEELESQINNVGVTAVTRFGTTAAAVNGMTDSVENSINGFNLLNDQDLDQLRSAMADANNRLREMQEETQSAKDRLSELNAEILEAQGQDQKAALLRQQLDYQQQLAEIEKQRTEAELLGNRELVAILNEQASKLQQLNDLRVTNIKAETDTGNAAVKTANTVRNAWREVGDTVDAVNQKAKGMDFSGAVEQSSRLKQNFTELQSIL